MIKEFLKNVIYVVLLFVAISVAEILIIRYYDFPISSVMMDKGSDGISSVFTETKQQQKWVSIKRISDNLKLAVIASEDQRFPIHGGFDVVEIEKVLHGLEKGKKIRGASTISQQVAKNIFLRTDKSMLRKGVEIYYTFLIELILSKERILEIYLNIAEFGENIFGVDRACHKHFGKSAEIVSKNEAALLAAVLPNPIMLKVEKPSSYLRRRQSGILKQMDNLGLDYLKKLE